MSNTLVMHDRQRRAERKGSSMTTSLEAHLERGRRRRAADSRSDLERLQDDADATMQSGWNYVAPIDANQVEDGQANFGFAETGNEEEE